MGRAWIAAALLVAVAACGEAPESGDSAAKAQAALELYRRRPAADTYQNFVKANAVAADEHGNPHDRVGVEYQVRALEVMAAEAERAHDLRLADDVVDRAGEIERRDLSSAYEEALRGAKDRLAAARGRAAVLLR